MRQNSTVAVRLFDDDDRDRVVAATKSYLSSTGVEGYDIELQPARVTFRVFGDDTPVPIPDATLLEIFDSCNEFDGLQPLLRDVLTHLDELFRSSWPRTCISCGAAVSSIDDKNDHWFHEHVAMNRRDVAPLGSPSERGDIAILSDGFSLVFVPSRDAMAELTGYLGRFEKEPGFPHVWEGPGDYAITDVDVVPVGRVAVALERADERLRELREILS